MPSCSTIIRLHLLIYSIAVCSAIAETVDSQRYFARFNGFNLTIKQTLTTLPDEQFLFKSEGKHLLGKFTESSRFKKNEEGQLIPLEYNYQLKILGIKRYRHINFDWNAQIAIETYKGKYISFPIAPGLYDTKLYQLQLRYDIKAQKSELSYNLIHRGKTVNYKFVVLEKSQVEYLGENIEVLKVKRLRANTKRETTFWLAPGMDYQMLRFTQIEKDGGQIVIVMEGVKDISTP